VAAFWLLSSVRAKFEELDHLAPVAAEVTVELGAIQAAADVREGRVVSFPDLSRGLGACCSGRRGGGMRVWRGVVSAGMLPQLFW